MKKVLLIEDNLQHATTTINIMSKLKNMYSVEYEIFIYLPQNGDTREKTYKKISEKIKSKIKDNSFDILMIDMLFGGDYENPIGLQIIKNMETELNKKYIIVYTEMSADELNPIREYNETIHNRIKIVTKPDLQVLTNIESCVGQERKKFLNEKKIFCNLDNRCKCEKKFLCSMVAIYFELEGK